MLLNNPDETESNRKRHQKTGGHCGQYKRGLGAPEGQHQGREPNLDQRNVSHGFLAHGGSPSDHHQIMRKNPRDKCCHCCIGSAWRYPVAVVGRNFRITTAISLEKSSQK
jgi:hypothetical protein